MAKLVNAGTYQVFRAACAGEGMTRTLLIGMAAALLLSTASVKGEPGPVGKWLMAEPVTLWDLGMIRAEKAVDNAAASLSGRVFGSVVYDWDNNEIVIYFRTFDAEFLTHAKCNEVRRHALTELAGAPKHYSNTAKMELIQDVIGAWFRMAAMRMSTEIKNLQRSFQGSYLLK